MARSAVLSNGRLCVGLDERGFVNDFYYPLVGLDNMTSARFIHHKIGIWVDGHFSWLDDQAWEHTCTLDENSMMARTHFVNHTLGISLSLRDFVHHEHDFFGRLVIVENRKDHARNIKLFFGQVFQISRSGRADTALYAKARHPYVMTYNRNITVVSGIRTMDGSSFDQFAVGNYGIEGKAGTYHDAEDGVLSGNVVEHGGVDSIIGTSFTIQPKGSYHVDYWNSASSRGYSRATRMHRAVATNGLYPYLNETVLHWKMWLSRSSEFIDKLDVRYQRLAKISLLTVRAHLGVDGGVIASSDSSIYNYGRDYYNYVWPRDAHYALRPLLRLGYSDEIKSYLDFVLPLIHPRGYVHHKYSPDGMPGSTWHPLVQYGEPELNIQEDETASMVILAVHYIRTTQDSTYHQKLIKKLIIPCTNFLADYFDHKTGLPHASYDLWEQVFLTNTYSVAITHAALCEALSVIQERGVEQPTEHWADAIDKIRTNMGKLFIEKDQWFARGLKPRQEGFEQVRMLDIASLYGVSAYGPLHPNDTAVYATQRAIEEHNVINGGVIRYRGDDYMLANNNYPANPWYVCTAWLGQHYLKIGDRDSAEKCIEWIISRATSSGMLSEQVDPETNEVRGVSPLVWSHAEFLSLLLDYYS